MDIQTRLSKSTLLATTLCLCTFLPAWSHHILGTPHYAYDEEYPQAPILTYSAEQGAYDVKMTCFPGKPRPGDNTSLHFYIKHRETGAAYSETVTLTVFKDRLIGDDPIVYGPIQGELEEAMFKFFPKFNEEANYTIRLEYEADGAPWILDLPMVAGEPGSPWTVVGSIALAAGVFLIIIRAIRIKRKRRADKKQRAAGNQETADAA
jgi:hypothetical protein